MLRKLITILLLTSASAASASSYYCKLDHSTYYQALIEVDAANGQARVYGDYSAQYYGHPINVKISERRDGKFRLRWKVRGLPGTITRTEDEAVQSVTRAKVTLEVRLVFNRDFSKLEFQERVPGGRGWSFPRSGSCSALKGNIEDYINL